VNAIHVVPLGRVDRRIIVDVLPALGDTFHAEVDIKELETDLEHFYDGTRGQYYSTAILQHLKQSHRKSSLHGPHTRERLLAISSEDLFIPILTFVFGEAELGGDAAIVSYHRLQNERYGLLPDPVLLDERFRKEVLHEMGHLFGLVHCSDQQCVMYAASYVEEIDLKGSVFCPACGKQLSSQF
jgi:archaemetzincin